MAKNKTKKKQNTGSSGRISLKDKLLHRIFWKDQQIAALLRGRDMRQRAIARMIKKNDMAMRVIAVLLSGHGGICAISAEDIMNADTGDIGVYEDTESKIVYIGRNDILRAVILRREDGDIALVVASADEGSGIVDTKETVKISSEDNIRCEGDDIDIEAIDDPRTQKTLEELRWGDQARSSADPSQPEG